MTEFEILDMLKSGNMEKFMEMAKSFKSYPLVIPSYKLRKGAKLVREIDTLIGHDIPVYIFVYKDDYTESGYDNIPHHENVKFVLIEEKDFKEKGYYYRSVAGKRAFIQDYMTANNMGIYFTMDDDATGTGRIRLTTKPNKIVGCTLDLMMRILSKISEFLPSGWMMLESGCNIEVLGSNFNSLYIHNKVASPRCFCLLNADNMNAKDVHYYGAIKNFSEDTKICFDIVKAGQPIWITRFLAPAFKCENKKESTFDRSYLWLGTIQMFKDNCEINIDEDLDCLKPTIPDGKVFVDNGCRYEWFKTDSYHKKLAELIDKIKDRNSPEYDEALEFVKKYKNKQDNLLDW